MANPVCLSPLKFYESKDWQTHKRSYSYVHITPLIAPYNTIPSFQFVLSDDILGIDSVRFHPMFGNSGYIDATQEMQDAGLESLRIAIPPSGNIIRVLNFYGEESPDIGLTEGEYFIELILHTTNVQEKKHFYSEVICFTNNLDDYIKIRYRNDSDNFYLKNGVVTFPDRFYFDLYFKTELGKPNYIFEEEATKRCGYNFIESQISKKVYRFNVIVPEFICDAMRIIRLCDNKKLFYKNQEYDMLSFNMDVDWQTQGDLAAVTCEFETDNIIVSLGGCGFATNE